jgi:hypothetical protein
VCVSVTILVSQRSSDWTATGGLARWISAAAILSISYMIHPIVPAQTAHVQVLITALALRTYSTHALALPTVLTVLARSLTTTTLHTILLISASEPSHLLVASNLVWTRPAAASRSLHRLFAESNTHTEFKACLPRATQVHVADRPSPFAHQFSCLSLLSPPV